MCRIAVLHGLDQQSGFPLVWKMLEPVQHRGFKNFEIAGKLNCVLGANRLDIVDRDNGQQPACNEDKSVFAVLSGEIYNHGEIRSALVLKGYHIKTKCDTEILVHSYEEYGPDLVRYLDGMFAFVIFDARSGKLLAARDPYGIKPLYMAQSTSGLLAFASEMKSFIPLDIQEVLLVPPGHYYWDNEMVQYYEFPSKSPALSFAMARDCLRHLLHSSVDKMVETDLPLAVFLSGGIDSAIVLYHARELHPDVTAISVGLKGSPDLAAAKDLCAYLGIKHIWAEYDQLDLKRLYEKVIYHLESFEPNLVRGSIFTFLMSTLANQHGYRVSLAGEGSDELFAGYTDFALMSDDDHVRRELFEFFRDLHRTQLLRWDKISMACAVEVRYPFMDQGIVEFAWNLPVDFKLGRHQPETTAKYLLRSAYADVLPHSIIDRGKVPMDEGACPGGKQQLGELIQAYISESGELCIDDDVIKTYKLASLEECYNFQVFAKHYGFAEFVRDRIKVRKN